MLFYQIVGDGHILSPGDQGSFAAALYIIQDSQQTRNNKKSQNGRKKQAKQKKAGVIIHPLF